MYQLVPPEATAPSPANPLRVVGPDPDGHLDPAWLLARSHDGERQLVAGFRGVDHLYHVVGGRDGLTSDLGYNVPGRDRYALDLLLFPARDAGLLGWAIRRHPAHNGPVPGQTVLLGELLFREAAVGGELVYPGREHTYPDVAVHHLPGGYDLLDHALHDVYRDSEAHALESAGLGGDLGVHPDNRAARVEQRSAGVAGVYRRVGLDRAVYGVIVGRFYGASDAAHDPGRDADADVQRIADGDDRLSDPDAARVTERQRLENSLRGVHLHDRHVGRRVLADDLRLLLGAAGERDRNLFGTLYDVLVGDDVDRKSLG